MWQKMLAVPRQLCLKYGTVRNNMGRLQKGNKERIKLSGQKTQSNTSEKRKCTTKEMKDKLNCKKPHEINGIYLEKSQT